MLMDIIKVKVKVNDPRNRPCVAQRFRFPDFHDIWHMKVVRSSVPRTGRLYPQGIFLVLIFTRSCVNPKAMVR
jgi:hypothetical protein